MGFTPPSAPSGGEKTIAERVADRLAIYLGPHTGRVAVKTFALKALGRGPETLAVSDFPKLEQALRPMLRTLLGSARAELVLAEIRRELGA
jgi:hypothetical protein